MGSMLPYMAAPWILWEIKDFWNPRVMPVWSLAMWGNWFDLCIPMPNGSTQKVHLWALQELPYPKKKTLSISFENFNFLLFKRFCAKTNNDDPFFPAACGASPGVYFRQQNSDDSKSLIGQLLLFCGPCAESATRFLLVSWCHRCHHWFFVGEKNQRFGFRVLFLSRNWGLESHIFVARHFYTLQTVFQSQNQIIVCPFPSGPMALLWKLDPLSTKTISF